MIQFRRLMDELMAAEGNTAAAAKVEPMPLAAQD
jgi:hypothetical protein